jgi:hypothetical protein
MGLHLTSDDLRRVAAAAEALLSPLAAPGPEAWWRGAERRVRELFPGANVLLSVPHEGRLCHDSESVPPAALRQLGELSAADPRTGLHVNRDPTIAAWHAYRRAHRLEVWTAAENFRALASLGYDGPRSAFYNDGLCAAGLADCVGLSTHMPRAGEWFVTIGYARPRRSRCGDRDAAVLGLLLPAVRAGHHALAVHGAQRSALLATLDGAADALLVVGGDGRELHRNVPLVRALAADPERDRVAAAMLGAARGLRELTRAGPAAPRELAAPVQPVVTVAARYTVRAVFAPEALWGAAGVVLVSLERASDAAGSNGVASGEEPRGPPPPPRGGPARRRGRAGAAHDAA